MTIQQGIIFATLLLTLVLFVTGRWRYDVVALVEAVVTENSPLIGETAYNLDLRRQHGVNLLAVARQGRRLGTRLDRVRLRAGDVLLLQCHAQTMRDVLATLACLPLA